MKKYAKQLTALTLALALAAGLTGQTAVASWALGSRLVERTTPLANGVTLTAQSMWSATKSDLRTENYITYAPGSGVAPMIYSGAHVVSRNTMAVAAADLEAQGHRVIAGVNGGFFNSDGTIVGMLMTEGVVRSLDVYNYALLGFTRDGRVFIDESRITKTVSWGTQNALSQYDLAGFNAYRNSGALGGLYLYNQDFAAKVGHDANRGCVAAVLSPVFGGEVTMNGTLMLSVETVMDTRAGDTFDGQLTDGRYMLYANYYNGNDALMSALRSLMPGQRVAVTVSGVSEQWANAAYGISGPYTLLRGGEIVPNLPTTVNPYTAVGIRADGAAVFYTIDGRQSGYSVGATYDQVAQRLQELGCVTAVALDGGGSTALGATLPGQPKFELMNQPSQANRPLNNFIFLMAGDRYAGMAPGFYLSSDTQVAFAGASLNVSAVGYDRWGRADPEMIPAWSAAGGTIEGDGLTAVFTAGDTAGTYTVSAGPGSELPVRVVDTLSSLRVTREGSSAAAGSLTLMPWDTVDLSVAGTWWNLPVALDGSDVTWEADASIGTIDASGLFTAAGWNEDVYGNITASVGGRTATVQVTVKAYPFADILNHWSADYVTRLYKMGLTNGRGLADGTVGFQPNAEMTRGELVVFIARLLHVDTAEYLDAELPFEDADSIPEWMLPSVKAMYALCVLNGSRIDGKLYANVNSSVSRQETMTMLGRVLAVQVSQELSGFADGDQVSDWAQAYVETLVALDVVRGNGGMLTPQLDITRGEVAKLLVKIDGLEKAELTPRPSEPGSGGTETQEPDVPDGLLDGPDQPEEDTGDPPIPDDSSFDVPG